LFNSRNILNIAYKTNGKIIAATNTWKYIKKEHEFNSIDMLPDILFIDIIALY